MSADRPTFARKVIATEHHSRGILPLSERRDEIDAYSEAVGRPFRNSDVMSIDITGRPQKPQSYTGQAELIPIAITEREPIRNWRTGKLIQKGRRVRGTRIMPKIRVPLTPAKQIEIRNSRGSIVPEALTIGGGTSKEAIRRARKRLRKDNVNCSRSK